MSGRRSQGYIRRKGYNDADAKDLTQSFFHEVVLGHNLVQNAEPSKGRFRSLLLAAQRRVLGERHLFTLNTLCGLARVYTAQLTDGRYSYTFSGVRPRARVHGAAALRAGK